MSPIVTATAPVVPSLRAASSCAPTQHQGHARHPTTDGATRPAPEGAKENT